TRKRDARTTLHDADQALGADGRQDRAVRGRGLHRTLSAAVFHALGVRRAFLGHVLSAAAVGHAVYSDDARLRAADLDAGELLSRGHTSGVRHDDALDLSFGLYFRERPTS